MKKKMGLLVMAYGTPYKEEDIERYYTHIRHGRKPSDELIADLKRRYSAIGGISPLAKITEQQADALVSKLNEIQDEIEFKVYVGLKHIEPYIEDAVTMMHRDGIEEAISIVLAPHFSNFSVKSYNTRASEVASELGDMVIHSVESWYKEPKFIEFWKNEINTILDSIVEKGDTAVIFSAHSLPEKILAGGDPYPEQMNETADLIADVTGIAHYYVGWQSAGQTPEPWIGPDVQDLTRELDDLHEYKHYIYAPVGFVAEHLEVLYDNDYECKVVTDEVRAKYHRPNMPNSHPLFIEGLANVVLEKINSVVPIGN